MSMAIYLALKTLRVPEKWDPKKTFLVDKSNDLNRRIFTQEKGELPAWKHTTNNVPNVPLQKIISYSLQS